MRNTVGIYFFRLGMQALTTQHFLLLGVIPILMVILLAGNVSAGPPLQKCYIGPPRTCSPPPLPKPRCGIELTCTDGFVRLGYPDGACFRATCPGVWALIHRRMDQKSFRRRFITYRHYHFVGYWKLKDQGMLETGPVPLRELFLVLPEDLIVFRMAAPDCNAEIQVRNFGYIKKGSVQELQLWLAQQRALAGPALTALQESRDERGAQPGCAAGFHSTWLQWWRSGPLNRVWSFGRSIGLPVGW